MAVRFMYEEHRNQYLQLAHFLKTDYFAGYKRLLDKSGKKYQQEFSRWLVAQQEEGNSVEEQENIRKPRQFYRYSYKDYLQPSHLTESLRHMHWQYWHENDLKAK
jgi:microbial collagenase